MSVDLDWNRFPALYQEFQKYDPQLESLCKRFGLDANLKDAATRLLRDILQGKGKEYLPLVLTPITSVTEVKRRTLVNRGILSYTGEEEWEFSRELFQFLGQNHTPGSGSINVENTNGESTLLPTSKKIHPTPLSGPRTFRHVFFDYLRSRIDEERKVVVSRSEIELIAIKHDLQADSARTTLYNWKSKGIIRLVTLKNNCFEVELRQELCSLVLRFNRPKIKANTQPRLVIRNDSERQQKNRARRMAAVLTSPLYQTLRAKADEHGVIEQLTSAEVELISRANDQPLSGVYTLLVQLADLGLAEWPESLGRRGYRVQFLESSKFAELAGRNQVLPDGTGQDGQEEAMQTEEELELEIPILQLELEHFESQLKIDQKRLENKVRMLEEKKLLLQLELDSFLSQLKIAQKRLRKKTRLLEVKESALEELKQCRFVRVETE